MSMIRKGRVRWVAKSDVAAEARLKSFQRKDGSDDGDGANFHGQQRRNDTHQSKTDPEAKLYRKGGGQEARLSYLRHVLVENRNGLIVDAMATVEDLGIAHELAVDAQTGAASFRVPITAPPGRNDSSPKLALTWSAGGGNSPYGLGWNLTGFPATGIDGTKHVPRWDGRDNYVLGGDELVPSFEHTSGEW